MNANRGAFHVAGTVTPIATYLLSIAGFSVLTSEFLIVGLLPAIASDLGVSISAAGILVTLFSVTIVLTGPFLTAAVAKWNKKMILVALMLVFAGSNLISALANDYAIMAVSRIIPALALPVFWGLADGLAVDLAGPKRAGHAVAIVTLGATLGSVFGVPLGVIAGDALGWRMAFGALAVLCLFKAFMLLSLPNEIGTSPEQTFRSQMALLKNPFLVWNTVLSALVFCTMFTAYTYFADILGSLAHLDGEWIGWSMMAFGAVGLIGNFLGGRAVDTMPMAATSLFSAIFAIGAIVAIALATSTPALAIGLTLWGIAQAALTVICSVRMVKSAMSAPAFAASLNVMGANVGIAAGAFVGGQVIDRFGLEFLGWGTAIFAAASCFLALRLAAVPAREPISV